MPKDPPRVNPQAIGLVVLYGVAMVVNGLLSAGVGVPLTNPNLSNTHPVPLTPPGWAFAIWGPIYLLIGAFVVAQALPRHAADPLYASLRPWAALALAANAAWLFLFSYQLFWLAFADISLYWYALVRAVGLVAYDPTATAPAEGPGTWLRLGAHAAFAANASWVTVATLLQLQINLQEEGYYPSEDLSVGMLGLAAGLACYRAHARADVVWVAVTAWALVAIRSNQQAGSDWGCLSVVCAACAEGVQRICESKRPVPLGWSAACAARPKTLAASCPLEKSALVASAASVAVATAAVCLVAGVARGLVARRAAIKAKEAGQGAAVEQPRFERLPDMS